METSDDQLGKVVLTVTVQAHMELDIVTIFERSILADKCASVADVLCDVPNRGWGIDDHMPLKERLGL